MVSIKKNILFITSANLAANPRLVKELRLAVDKGFAATVIQCWVGNWSDAGTDQLKSEFPSVLFFERSTLRKPLMPWLISTVIERVCRLLPFSLLTDKLLSFAVSKRSYLLLHEIKKINTSFQWVIAHNPAAFYPAMIAAEKSGALLGIDVEDYHPGETNDPGTVHLMKELMRKVLPTAAYCSFASPLIQKYTEHDIPAIDRGRSKVVNNIFPANEFLMPPPEVNRNRKLKFTWFSQFIDYGRGLEKLLPVFDRFADSVECTLIGFARDGFLKNELLHRSYITCIPSMSQLELHQQLPHYDIGLAVEDRQADVNRNICLTNKIWAFFQAGLYIMATDTDAQKTFLQQYPLHGELISADQDKAIQTIESLISRKEEILAGKPARYKNAEQFSWEQEAEILSSEWDKNYR
ncbi:MAG: hypothetical protein ABL872_01220 [Lacibacter sp.]